METEHQIDPSTPALKSTQGSSKAPSTSHHVFFALLSLVFVILGMGLVYLWQHKKVNSLNAQVSNMQDALIKDAAISKDEQAALSALPNIVVDSANSPADLIAFLGANNPLCYRRDGNGYYKVIAQANDKFAEMQYGCTAKGGTTPLGSSPTHILAKKTGSSWSLISPTDQWRPIAGQDVPSCTMVNDNGVSRLVTPQCWQEPASNNSSNAANQTPTVVQVTNP